MGATSSARHIYRLFFVLVIAAMLMSCSRSQEPLIERGAEYQFRQGYPEVRMTALGILDEDGEGVIRIASDISYGSLIFRERGGESVADIDIEIRITGIEGTRFSDTYTTTKTVKRDNIRNIRQPEVMQFLKELDVPAGNYEVRLSVTDKSSERRTSRSARTFVPDPAGDIVSLSAVQLQGVSADRRAEGYAPITTYTVSTRKDSLRFVVQVTNSRSETPLSIQSRLIRFEADTTPARSMHAPNYSTSSLPYKGIDFRSYEVVDQTRREFDQPGSVMVEFPNKRPGRGNYRFEIRVTGQGEELYRARDFSVKGENFPHIRSPRELAEPLVYLMGSREYRELMAIEDPVRLKEAVDHFWLSNVGSMERARQVISLYYDRVEQANKQFTTFKEGWKTDQGMVYILFGPPWYETTRLNRLQWSYSYNRSDPNYNYLFVRQRAPSEHFPFNHYLLRRSQNYFTIQYQQVQRWKTGQILQSVL